MDHTNHRADAPFDDDDRQGSSQQNENVDNNFDHIDKDKTTHTKPPRPASGRLLSELSSRSDQHSPTSTSSRPSLLLSSDTAGSNNASIPLSSYSLCTSNSSNPSINNGQSNSETSNICQEPTDIYSEEACENGAVKGVKFTLDSSIKVRDVICPCKTDLDIPASRKLAETASTGNGKHCGTNISSSTNCENETDEDEKHCKHKQYEEPCHKSVTFHEHTIQANSPTSSTDRPTGDHEQEDQEKLWHHDDDNGNDDNRLHTQQENIPEERNDSNHSSLTHYQTAYSHSRTFSLHSNKTAGSRSERFFDRHLRGRSVHSEGNSENASASSQNKNSFFAKLFVRSTRTRTVTTSRRSGLAIGELLRDAESTAGENTEVASSVIVDRSKGRSNFVHRVTAEALPHLTLTRMKTGNNDSDNTGAGRSIADACQGQSTSVSNNDNRMPKLAATGRADSVKKERRGRTFFRTKERKRSRAKSPGPRPVFENGKVVGSATATAGMGMNVSNVRWIRRESPSPKPAARGRSWPRKVMSRAERDRRAALKKKEGCATDSNTPSSEKDTKVKKKECPSEKNDNEQDDYESTSRLTMLN